MKRQRYQIDEKVDWFYLSEIIKLLKKMNKTQKVTISKL